MIGYLICRIVQVILSSVVLALSIIATEWQWAYRLPRPTVFAAFVGAWGCLFGLMGLAPLKLKRFDRFVQVYDGLTVVLFLASGITYAVALRGINCGKPNSVNTWGNSLISGGCIFNFYNDGNYACGYDDQAFQPQATHRCKLVEANAALTFFASIAAVLCLLQSLRATKSRRAATAAATSPGNLAAPAVGSRT